MTVRIAKSFSFSASHQLRGLEPGHPCGRLHGHNYSVELAVLGQVDSRGFVVDYRELAFFGAFVDDVLDHQHLNDVLPRQLDWPVVEGEPVNPTAEHLASWLAQMAAVELETWGVEAVEVTVSETAKTTATVRVEVDG